MLEFQELLKICLAQKENQLNILVEFIISNGTITIIINLRN